MGLRIALTHVYSWPEIRRGAERYLHELAAALSDAGHDATILSTATRPNRDRVLGVEVRYLRRNERRLARWFGPLAAEADFGARAFFRLVGRSLDVWHAFGTADAAAAGIAGSVRGLRSVYTDLGISARSWREHRPDRRLYHSVLRRVDRYLCLSEAAAASVRRDYGREVAVVGGGVDLRRFAPEGRRHPTPVLLFASALNEERKNLAMLLDALAMLRRRRPTVELWLAGPGDPTPHLERAPAAAREAVSFLGVGSPADLIRLYGRAWATILPASGEAFGLVVLESFACGTPAVTLDEGGPAELVGPGTGATSRPTPEALADACERALDLAAARETVERCRAAAEPHDWRRGIVPRLERIYQAGAGRA